MYRFLGTNLWAELLRVGKMRGTKRLAIAYYSADSHVRCGRGDTLIVDASPKAIQTRQTSPMVLLAAARRGTRIYTHPKLHAKIVLTKHCAIIGSANLSATSRSLREAGVLVTGQKELERVNRYLDWLQQEARELSESDIEILLALPQERNWRSSVAKPSLLEAIDRELPSLEDVSFSWYTTDGELARNEVRAAARQHHVYLPSGSRWAWYESPNTRGVLSKTIKLCRDRPLVTWEGYLGADDRLKKFRANDPQASAFIDAFVFQRRVVSIVGQHAFTTPFDLRRDRKRLALILSAGLEYAPIRLRNAINNDVGVIKAQQLIELYRLGSQREGA